MKKILLLASFILPTLLFSQKDTTHITTHYRNGVVNENYVLNKNGEKDGAYLKQTKYGKVYTKGQYNNGVPTGTWEYYTSDTVGTLVEKLDFDAHKELFVDPLRVHSLICGPRFFGGNMAQKDYLHHRVITDFTADERAKYKDQRYSVSFVVDSTTYKPIAASIVVDANTPVELSQRMITMISEMPVWLPPVCRGEGEVWRFTVWVDFSE
ncbi:MAG TPA: hypothetical protein VL651_10680 [Bacteroidia bacterium]|jgi:hypothetical protein|nr:hypothetical protein [Bacteroidia bacterium]